MANGCLSSTGPKWNTHWQLKLAKKNKGMLTPNMYTHREIQTHTHICIVSWVTLSLKPSFRDNGVCFCACFCLPLFLSTHHQYYFMLCHDAKNNQYNTSFWTQNRANQKKKDNIIWHDSKWSTTRCGSATIDGLIVLTNTTASQKISKQWFCNLIFNKTVI